MKTAPWALFMVCILHFALLCGFMLGDWLGDGTWLGYGWVG